MRFSILSILFLSTTLLADTKNRKECTIWAEALDGKCDIVLQPFWDETALTEALTKAKDALVSTAKDAIVHGATYAKETVSEHPYVTAAIVVPTLGFLTLFYQNRGLKRVLANQQSISCDIRQTFTQLQETLTRLTEDNKSLKLFIEQQRGAYMSQVEALNSELKALKENGE